jgi:2-keto-3-deoxy-L-rhamnonate aldolase RhmA
MLPGANHARIMARSGFDWVCVDTEHGNIAGEILFASWEDYGDRGEG